MDTMNTKEKTIGVTAIMPIVLLSAAMVREFWAIFVIVGLLAIAYLVSKHPKEAMVSEQ